jgi:hypothetical protein
MCLCGLCCVDTLLLTCTPFTTPPPPPPPPPARARATTGADLQAAAGNVGNSLPQGARGFLGYVTTHINSPQVGALTDCRSSPPAHTPHCAPILQHSMQQPLWMRRLTGLRIFTGQVCILPMVMSARTSSSARTSNSTSLHTYCFGAAVTHQHMCVSTPPPPNTPLQILPFLEAAVEARAEIAPALAGNRDLLYLDVALENSIRGAAERGVGSAGACGGGDNLGHW